MNKLILGPSWILLPTVFDLQICHIPDLVWAYKKVTKRSVNFIPTGKTYAAVLHDRYGKPVEIQATQEEADEMLQMLVGKAPWAIFGFSDELKSASEKDWKGLVAAVDDRRLQVGN